jgi:aminoglycoside phosphotransferase (APT) family kinase protein
MRSPQGKDTGVASNLHKTLKPDLAISCDQAQAIVNRIAEPRTVARVTTLHGGELCAVYEISLTEGSPSLVLKVYPDALQWKMQKEVSVARLLQDRLSVPIPHVLLVDDTKSLMELNFIVMSKLDGDILLGLERTLPQAEVHSIYWQMGRLLREIHCIPIDAFGYIGPHGVWTPYASNQAYMSFQFGKKLTEFVESGGASELADRLGAFVERRAHLLDGCAAARLCHYDFHGGNVLIERKDGSLHVSGILDFENAIAGDPLMDIAKTLNYAVREDQTKRSGLLAGYGTIERPDWEETLALYRMYCVLELWCWMAQIGNSEPLAGLTLDLERAV